MTIMSSKKYAIYIGYVIVKEKESTAFPSLCKTHIPIGTERTTRINSKPKSLHLITKEGSHTIGVGCHITAQSVLYYFSSIILVITDMATIKFSEVLPFFGITTSIRPTP